MTEADSSEDLRMDVLTQLRQAWYVVRCTGHSDHATCHAAYVLTTARCSVHPQAGLRTQRVENKTLPQVIGALVRQALTVCLVLHAHGGCKMKYCRSNGS